MCKRLHFQRVDGIKRKDAEDSRDAEMKTDILVTFSTYEATRQCHEFALNLQQIFEYCCKTDLLISDSGLKNLLKFVILHKNCNIAKQHSYDFLQTS
ncbi:hypothetical protein DU58_04615 [Methanosarcina mazei]|uniref:Uncharacterized protein n=1 Tax=Methanosarcina mazei TaxID=2209 RepID=A0A0F8GF57_METMZ|nr:hypothetical protein DU30_13820 [Methanosarcina mazei]KKH33459.1 hypothetical protein DU58_04615 [Methanosarcina mazei]